MVANDDAWRLEVLTDQGWRLAAAVGQKRQVAVVKSLLLAAVGDSKVRVVPPKKAQARVDLLYPKPHSSS